MKNLAVHMRISGVTVSDNDVESRRFAASNLATKWEKISTVSEIVSKAECIALSLGGDGVSSEPFVTEVQTAIQKKSPAYLASERALDIGICCGMAMVSLFEASSVIGGWTSKEVYAAALWSALSYQTPLGIAKREELRVEVLSAAASFSNKMAENARTRSVVPDLSSLKIELDEHNQATINFKSVMGKTIDALRNNAALDREELDFLWWAQLGRSRLLKKQLSEISEPTRIVAAGIEGAKLLRRLPCEVHREIVLRSLDKNPELNLTELLSDIGEDRILLSDAVNTEKVVAHPTVFPLLHALSTGHVDNFGYNEKRHVSEWGERALLEATFARFMSQGAGKV